MPEAITRLTPAWVEGCDGRYLRRGRPSLLVLAAALRGKRGVDGGIALGLLVHILPRHDDRRALGQPWGMRADSPACHPDFESS